jgi:hypothetical protein
MHGPPRVQQARATLAGGAEQVAHLPLEPDRLRWGDRAGASGGDDAWTKASRIPRFQLAPGARHSRRRGSRQAVREPHIGQRGSREIKATIP